MTLRRPLSRPTRRPTCRLALEPRIVFDGAMPAAAAAAEHHEAPAAPPPVERHVAITGDAGRGAAGDQEHRTAQRGLRPTTPHDGGSENAPATAAPAADREIAFVDASVADIESYLPGFKGRVVTLDAGQDGLDQIAATLAGQSGITAIHILSHGEAGLLFLGDATLDTAGITGAHAADVAAIKAALAPGGDLLLYGCDVAAGTVGQAFIEALAAATGGDVAASTDDTGAADLGGNWTLEAHVGLVQTRSIDASGWEGMLAPPVVVNDSFNGKEDISFTFDPRGNDSDPQGYALTITQINGTAITADSLGVAVTGGVVVLNESGSLTFVPTLNFAGNSTFSYTVSNGHGGSGTASVTLAINPVDDAPVVDLNGPSAATTPLTADGVRDASAPTNSWEVLLYGGSQGVAGTSAPNNADRTQSGAAGSPVLLGEIYLGQDDTPLVIRDSDIEAGERAQNPLIRSGNAYGGTYAANPVNGDFDPANGSVFQYVAVRTMTAPGTISLGQAGSAIDDSAEVFVNGVRVAQNLTFTYNLPAPLTASFNAGDVVEIRLTNQGGVGAFSLDAVIANLDHATTYTENALPVSIASPSITVTDPDNTNMTSATITLTNPVAGDYLSVIGTLPSGITTTTYDATTGTLTLTGSATSAAYASAIAAIGFGSTSDDPTNASRVIDVTVNDGTVSSATAVTTVAVTPVDDAPAVNLNANTNLLVDGGFDNTQQPNLDANNLQGTTYGAYTSNVQINIIHVDGTTYAAGPDRADSGSQYLDLAGDGYIQQSFTLGAATSITFGGAFSNRDLTVGSYTPPTSTIQILDSHGTVVATGSTVSLTRANGAEAWYASTGTATLAAGTYTYRVTMGDYAHADSLYVRAGPNYTTSYTENAAPIAIASPLDAVTDADDANATAAVITLTNPVAGDYLSVVGALPSGITASAYDGTTHTITLTGSATRAAYATAIADIAFASTSDDPTSASRTVAVAVTTGGLTSPTATSTINVVPVDDAPTSAAPSGVSGAEDTTFAFGGPNALTVADVDNPVLTVSLGVGHGTLSLGTTTGLSFTTGNGNANASMVFSGTQAQLDAALASLTFRPGPDYNGSDTLSFTTSDGLLSTSKSIALTIAPVADIRADQVTTNENTAVSFNAITGTNGATADTFSDPNRAITSVTQGAHGSVAFSANGTLTYTPNANFSGTDSFSYTVTAGGTTETASVTMTVQYVDQPPVAVGDAFTISVGTVAVVDVRANDADVDGDPLVVTRVDGTAVAVGGPPVAVTGGTVALDASGRLVFAPNAGYVGSTAFTYTVSDPSGATSTATVNGTVTAGLHAPVAVADTLTVAENAGPTIIDVRGNDVDVAHDPLTITQIDGTALVAGGAGVAVNGGTVALDGGGRLVFTPTANFNGPAGFSYTISDPSGSSSTATVGIAVTPGAHAPVATADAFTVAENAGATPLDVRVNDVGSGANPLAITQIDGNAIQPGGTAIAVAGGSVTLDPSGNLTFTPAADTNGPVSFRYTITDPNGSSSTATVAVNVAPGAQAPIATPDSLTIAENAAATVVPVLANDVDAAHDPLTITRIDGQAIAAGGAGIAVSGGVVNVDVTGRLLFTPAANFNGPANFTYTISDPAGSSSTAAVHLTVAPTDIGPVARPDQASGAGMVTIDVLANDTDASGTIDPATVQLVGTAHPGDPLVVAGEGTFAIDRTRGAITFTPVAGFTGTAIASYSVADGNGARSAATTASATVRGSDAPPVANADGFTVAANGSVTIAVLANDTDADGDPLTVTRVDGQPIVANGPAVATAYGSVTLDAAGNLHFTPAPNTIGAASFTYTVSDPSGATSTATVSGSVTATANAPLAQPDVAFGEAGAPITIVVLDNDRAVAGDPVRVSAIDGQAIAVGGPGVAIAGGVITLAADGRLQFVPNASNGALAATSFVYTITSRSGSSSSAVVRLDLFGVTNPPLPDPAATGDARADGAATAGAVIAAAGPAAGSPVSPVLQGVADARAAFARDRLAASGVDLPTAAEIVSDANDDLRVDAQADALYVQHAVRHEALTSSDALHVLHAVEASQREARLLGARTSSPDGPAASLDPFALGNAFATSARAIVPATNTEATPGHPAGRHAAVDAVPLDALSLDRARPAASAGFTAQLRHDADALRVRPAVRVLPASRDLPVPRELPVARGLLVARAPRPEDAGK